MQQEILCIDKYLYLKQYSHDELTTNYVLYFSEYNIGSLGFVPYIYIDDEVESVEREINFILEEQKDGLEEINKIRLEIFLNIRDIQHIINIMLKAESIIDLRYYLENELFVCTSLFGEMIDRHDVLLLELINSFSWHYNILNILKRDMDKALNDLQKYNMKKEDK